MTGTRRLRNLVASALLMVALVTTAAAAQTLASHAAAAGQSVASPVIPGAGSGSGGMTCCFG